MVTPLVRYNPATIPPDSATIRCSPAENITPCHCQFSNFPRQKNVKTLQLLCSVENAFPWSSGILIITTINPKWCQFLNLQTSSTIVTMQCTIDSEHLNTRPVVPDE